MCNELGLVVISWVVVILVVFAILIVQHCFKWVDDDNSIVYNVILKYIMVEILKYECMNDPQYVMYRRLSGNDVEYSCYGEHAMFLCCLCLTSLILIVYNIIPSLILITCVSVAYITRYVVRLSKRINTIESK